jgi:hypothetical protein
VQLCAVFNLGSLDLGLVVLWLWLIFVSSLVLACSVGSFWSVVDLVRFSRNARSHQTPTPGHEALPPMLTMAEFEAMHRLLRTAG